MFADKDVLRRVPSGTHELLDVFGPTIEFLVSPDEGNDGFCVIRGTIPPGAFVPIHSHRDVETFFVVSGEIEGLREGESGFEWIRAKTGDFMLVPSGAKHAWRNVSKQPSVQLVTTTAKLGRWFQEVGRPATGKLGPPTADDLQRFISVSAKYGYWLATPEENAAVGIFPF